ncbi:hypothetical protein GEMRC1_013368 [Eukaryota sp. GEM-RC1]
MASFLLLLLLVTTVFSTTVVFTDVQSPSSAVKSMSFTFHIVGEVVCRSQCEHHLLTVSSDDVILSNTSVLLCPNSTLLSAELDVSVPSIGFKTLVASCQTCEGSLSVSTRVLVIPGPVTLLPAIITLALAGLTSQTIPALIIGTFLSAMISSGTLNPLTGFQLAVGKYLVAALSSHSHASLSIFFVWLGAIIGLIAKSGGSKGLSRIISKIAKTSTLAQAGLFTHDFIDVV